MTEQESSEKSPQKRLSVGLLIVSVVAVLAWLQIIIFFGIMFIGGYRSSTPFLSYPPLIFVAVSIPTSLLLCWKFRTNEVKRKFHLSFISLVISLLLSEVTFFWVFFLFWMDAIISEF